MKTKTVALIIMVHLLSLITYLYVITYSHEQFHQANARNFGCVNGTIKINWRGGSFHCDQWSLFQTKEERLELNKLDSLNELVTYNATPFAVLLTMLSITVFLSLAEIMGKLGGEMNG